MSRSVTEDSALGLLREYKERLAVVESRLNSGDVGGGGEPAPHNHDDRYYTEAEVAALLAAKQDASTAATDAELTTHKSSADHDGRYYTEAEVNALLAAKQDASTAATDAELTTHKTSSDHDGRYYTESEIDAMFANVTPRKAFAFFMGG